MGIHYKLHNVFNPPHLPIALSNDESDASALQPCALIVRIQNDQNGSGLTVFALSLVVWIELLVFYPSL